MSEPSRQAFDMIAACEAAHFGEGLCAECVDALLGKSIAAQTKATLHGAGFKEMNRQNDELRAALAQAEQEIPRLSEQNRQLGLELFEAQQLRKQAERERDLAKRLVNRLPLCPDHRDKFQPEQCQACRAEQAEQAVANERKDSEDALTERDAFQAENHRLLVETMELRTRLAEAKQRGRAADAYDAVYRRLMESSAHGRLDSDVWYALTKAHDMLDALQPPLKNSARHRAAQP